jgi:hypothetical protein
VKTRQKTAVVQHPSGAEAPRWRSETEMRAFGASIPRRKRLGYEKNDACIYSLRINSSDCSSRPTDAGHSPQFVQLYAQPMTQWAFRPQLINERFGLGEDIVRKLTLLKQLPPTLGNFLFGKQLGPPGRKSSRSSDNRRQYA